MSEELLSDEEIGKNLRFLRKRNGITQQELGNALNISFQQIQKYEKGRNRLSVSSLLKIADYMGENPSAFYDGTFLCSSGPRAEAKEISRETFELISIFQRIRDKKIRKQIKSLLVRFAQQGEDSDEEDRGLS